MVNQNLPAIHDSESSALELKNEGGYTYLIIEIDRKNKWLYYKWRGFLLMDELKTGYTKILEVLQREKLTAALADHVNIVGPWNEANNWLINDWSPQISKAGLKLLAINTAGDLFSNISLELFIIDNLQATYETKVFDSAEEAKKWLLKKNTPDKELS